MGTITTAPALLFWLVVAHCLCDYPLQGDFLAKAKNHSKPIPGVPYWQALLAHAMIQAGGVAVVTRSIPLALAELVAHAAIDAAKCDELFGFGADQALHVLCKLVWLALLWT